MCGLAPLKRRSPEPPLRGIQSSTLRRFEEYFKIVTFGGDQNTDLVNFTFTKNIGMLLLAIYLIVIGLSTIFALAISGVITGVLALAAGIFILIGR